MKRSTAFGVFGLAIALLAGACGPTGYYIADVYVHDNDLYTKKCAIDAGRNSDKPDPSNCRFERVGGVPAELLAQLPPPQAATPPTPPPVAPPTPPPATPPAAPNAK